MHNTTFSHKPRYCPRNLSCHIFQVHWTYVYVSNGILHWSNSFSFDAIISNSLYITGWFNSITIISLNFYILSFACRFYIIFQLHGHVSKIVALPIHGNNCQQIQLAINMVLNNRTRLFLVSSYDCFINAFIGTLLLYSSCKVFTSISLLTTIQILMRSPLLENCPYSSCSRPYFSPFGLNTKRYSVFLYIQFGSGKSRTRKTPYTDNFQVVHSSMVPWCTHTFSLLWL